MKTEFICSHCGQNKVHEDSLTTGYATNDKGEKICFACCGEIDRKYLNDNGKLSGYFTESAKDGDFFTNWPGTLKLRVTYKRKSWHNWTGKNGRTDFWIHTNDASYHGVQIGHNSQCATIRKVKK